MRMLVELSRFAVMVSSFSFSATSFLSYSTVLIIFAYSSSFWLLSARSASYCPETVWMATSNFQSC